MSKRFNLRAKRVVVADVRLRMRLGFSRKPVWALHIRRFGTPIVYFPGNGSASVAVVLDAVMLDSTDLDTLDCATQSFSQVLSSLDATDLDRPTACGGWTVKGVANHVCGGALRYAHYLRGGMPDEIAWTRTADNVGHDPRSAHDKLSAELRILFTQPGAGSTRAHHPMQTISGTMLLRMRVVELAVHAWDITSTLEATSKIDNDLAAYLLDRAAPILQVQREHALTITRSAQQPHDPIHNI